MAVSQGIVSVANDFEDKELAGSELSLLGLEPVFPDSTALFFNQSGNESALAFIDNLTASGIRAKLSPILLVKLILPSVINLDGKTYYLDNRELTLNMANAPSEKTNVSLLFNFESNGNSVTGIDTASIRFLNETTVGVSPLPIDNVTANETQPPSDAPAPPQ